MGFEKKKNEGSPFRTGRRLFRRLIHLDWPGVKLRRAHCLNCKDLKRTLPCSLNARAWDGDIEKEGQLRKRFGCTRASVGVALSTQTGIYMPFQGFPEHQVLSFFPLFRPARNVHFCASMCPIPRPTCLVWFVTFSLAPRHSNSRSSYDGSHYTPVLR